MKEREQLVSQRLKEAIRVDVLSLLRTEGVSDEFRVRQLGRYINRYKGEPFQVGKIRRVLYNIADAFYPRSDVPQSNVDYWRARCNALGIERCTIPQIIGSSDSPAWEGMRKLGTGYALITVEILDYLRKNIGPDLIGEFSQLRTAGVDIRPAIAMVAASLSQIGRNEIARDIISLHKITAEELEQGIADLRRR